MKTLSLQVSQLKCIKGTRIPVYQILQMLANGDTIEDLLEEYPSIKQEDILACLEYAGALAEEQLSTFPAWIGMIY